MDTAKTVGIVLGCFAAVMLAAILYFRKRIYIWWVIVSTKKDKRLLKKLKELKKKPSYKKSKYLQGVLEKAILSINPKVAFE
jgi:hypothetical protein